MILEVQIQRLLQWFRVLLAKQLWYFIFLDQIFQPRQMGFSFKY
jgi:hypothetical protein